MKGLSRWIRRCGASDAVGRSRATAGSKAGNRRVPGVPRRSRCSTPRQATWRRRPDPRRLPAQIHAGLHPVAFSRVARSDADASMLLPIPGMQSGPPNAMIGRLESRSLCWIDLSDALQVFLGRARAPRQPEHPPGRPPRRPGAGGGGIPAGQNTASHDLVLRLTGRVATVGITCGSLARHATSPTAGSTTSAATCATSPTACGPSTNCADAPTSCSPPTRSCAGSTASWRGPRRSSCIPRSWPRWAPWPRAWPTRSIIPWRSR